MSPGDRGRAPNKGSRGEQVEGKRAVLELLRAEQRAVQSVHLARVDERDTVLEEIAARAGPRLQVVSPGRLAEMARSDAAQGVIARAAPIRFADLDDLLDTPDAFLVALDGVTDPRNLGAVLRSAETAGATGVVLPRHRSARITPAVAKAAAGAIEYVSIAEVAGIPTALERAARRSVWTIGLDERGEQSIDDVAIADQPIVLVFGAEGRGLSRLTRDRCDVVASIPTYGRLASLNVASAAAIACHAVARRRRV
jgi:23S rRNA (guanosine2251-2'-O)-methyltransferase